MGGQFRRKLKLSPYSGPLSGPLSSRPLPFVQGQRRPPPGAPPGVCSEKFSLAPPESKQPLSSQECGPGSSRERNGGEGRGHPPRSVQEDVIYRYIVQKLWAGPHPCSQGVVQCQGQRCGGWMAERKAGLWNERLGTDLRRQRVQVDQARQSTGLTEAGEGPTLHTWSFPLLRDRRQTPPNPGILSPHWRHSWWLL